MRPPVRPNSPLRRLGAVLGILVLLFGLLAGIARNPAEVTLVSRLTAPFRAAVDWVTGQWWGGAASLNELARLRSENAMLESQIRAAAQLEAQNALLAPANGRLRAERLMKESAAYPLLTTEVIERSSDSWYRTVVINRGARDGVEPNMAIVNWQGLVGKVLQTGPDTAVVQLVTDSGLRQDGFGAGARLSTGEIGFVDTNREGRVRLSLSVSRPPVQPGQPVFTSGLGILPPDLLIGYVQGLDSTESALQNVLEIRPAVDFNKLDILHVVLYPTGQDRGTHSP